MWEAVGRWRVELLLAVLSCPRPPLEDGSNKDKANTDRPLRTWEIHLEFISHINHFSAERSHKSHTTERLKWYHFFGNNKLEVV